MNEFIKYPKIYQIGHKENEGILSDKEDIIYIQEKVDGANLRFYITDEGKLVFGSRTQQITSDDGEYTNVQKNFTRCLNYINDILKDQDLSEYKNCIFFGEAMFKHTIGYDWENTPPFLGFDIYDTNDNSFYETEAMMNAYASLGLEHVPLIEKCVAGKIKQIDDDFVPKSRYYSGKAEGIVFKNYEKKLYAKYVRKEFKEKNLEEFGGNKKHAATDEDYFTAVYCTNERIEKIVWKLMDDGEELELKMMPKLIKAVYKDIWEENWDEIVNTRGKTISFDKLKKSFTQRCFHVLNNIITNNSLK